MSQVTPVPQEAPRPCSSCGKTKPADDFYMQSANPAHKAYGRRQGRCKDCVKSSTRQWRAENADLYRERMVGYRLRFRYKIDPGQYAALLAAQGNCCAICGQEPEPGTRRLHVDHDHETGAVRGLLCVWCNTSIGLFGEDMRLLARAAAYLDEQAAA